MSDRLQIDCATRDDRLDAYRRIRRVGGPNLPGIPPPDASKVMSALRRRGMPMAQKRRWNLSVEEAIDGVREGKWRFYIELGPYDTVNVDVVRSPAGQLYLKSELDQDTPDQLLVLPQCR